MSREVIGNKGKGKVSTAEGILTAGDFLKAVGLNLRAKDPMRRFQHGYSKPKSHLPTFDVRSVTNEVRLAPQQDCKIHPEG